MPLGAFRLNTLAKSQVAGFAGRDEVTLTTYGNAQVDTAQYKFGGASCQMDGSGDGVLMDGAFDWSGDFTAEAFIRLNTVSSTQLFFRVVNTAGSFIMWFGIQGSSNKIGVYKGGFTVGTTALSTATWYHVAMEFESSSGACRFYLNGNYQGARTITAPGTVDVFMGSPVDSTMNGWMDEVRLTAGKRYDVGTGNFTAPTAAFVNDADTQCLVHADGTDGSTTFTDDSGVRAPLGISAIGNTQVDTAQYKYGSASVQFDGSGDYLAIAQSADFDFGTSGDFTIEGWYRITTGGNRGVFHLHNSYLPSAITGLAFAPRTDISGYVVYHGSSTSAIYPASGPSTGTWQHWAITRESGTMNIYVDGDRIKTRADTFDYNYQYLAIGGYYSSSYLFNGHMDEFRVSNTARYTGASYTVPTAAFENDANTLLLIHGEGTDTSQDFRDDNGYA